MKITTFTLTDLPSLSSLSAHVIAPSECTIRLAHWPARLESVRLAPVWGYGALIVMNLLYASFYPVAQPLLSSTDPLLVIALQMLLLVPPALFLLLWTWRTWIQGTLLRGLLLGTGLSAGLLCLTLALAQTSIAQTALFACLNGVIVVLISWSSSRRAMQPLTWLACGCALTGALVLLAQGHWHWQGNLLAFVGGLLFTGYGFLLERFYASSTSPAHAVLPDPGKLCRRALLSIQFLVMASETMFVALLFGNWHAVHLSLWFVVASAYCSGATVLIPMLILLLVRPYVNGVTATFLDTTEPLASVAFACLAAHEPLTPLLAVGCGLALASTLCQTVADLVETRSSAPAPQQVMHPFQQECAALHYTPRQPALYS
jgi:drug/metabolite transporter (DMT)-like permease